MLTSAGLLPAFVLFTVSFGFWVVADSIVKLSVSTVTSLPPASKTISPAASNVILPSAAISK